MKNQSNSAPRVLRMKTNFETLSGVAQVLNKKIRLAPSVSLRDSRIGKLPDPQFKRVVSLQSQADAANKRRRVLARFLSVAAEMRQAKHPNGIRQYTSVKIDIEKECIFAVTKGADGKFTGKVVKN